MKKHLLGHRISGYKIICDFNNERVLAYSRTAPQQWVIWRVDHNSDMYLGKYFADAIEAKEYFLQSVSDTRTTDADISGISVIKTEMMEGTLLLKYNNNVYDILSKHLYDFTDDPHQAWKAYMRELKSLVRKQVFEILNFEKMSSTK